VLNREDVISIIIIATAFILTYKGILTPDHYLTIISAILAYYLGQTIKMHQVNKALAYREGITRSYQRMIRRFGAFLMISGITLIIEKWIISGATYTFPPHVLDHGLIGLILEIIGFILLIRKEKRK